MSTGGEELQKAADELEAAWYQNPRPSRYVRPEPPKDEDER